jgi:predicted ATP-binding protein involved in virulence
MIAWTVDFAARMVERYPDSPQPLHEPAIVLVDELDLHLHPRWQREIIGFLTKQFPKTQFIVTAHSPLVVQAAQDVDANIVLLRRVGDHVKIDQNVRIDRNLTVDLLLTSDAFGLEALYSPRTEELMREQELLQAKSHLKATEQERLKQIEQEIGLIPITSNPIDNEAMTLIREAAELLKAKNKEKVAKPRSTQTTKSITLKVKSAGSGDKTPSTQTTKSKKKHNVHGTHS